MYLEYSGAFSYLLLCVTLIGFMHNYNLFIDEIQNVNGFEDVLEAYRLEEEYSIFITGSNSYLLSGELATVLTGRYVEFEVFTLSFEEYLKMKEFYGKTISNDVRI